MKETTPKCQALCPHTATCEFYGMLHRCKGTDTQTELRAAELKLRLRQAQFQQPAKARR